MDKLTTRQRQLKAFISYSHRDSEFVDKLITSLIESEIQIWFDRWEIKVGDSIIEKIANGINENDTLIVILSQSSVSSNWVKKELNSALIKQLNENEVTILPVLIEKCEIPLLIKEIKYADFTEKYENGWLELLRCFTDQPPQHFTQALGITENTSPEANKNNDKAADLILEACRTESRTSKFKIFDKAESMLSKVLSKEPRFGQARQNLGTIQLERGIVLNDEKLIQESINIFIQALENLSHFTQIAICNYSIGKAYARLGNLKDNNIDRLKLYKQAIPFLMKAIEEDKKLHFAYYWLAKVYHETYKVTQHDSDYRNAKKYFTEAVLLNPSYMDSLGEMEELNRSPEKTDSLGRWVGLDSTRSSGSISKLWRSLLSKIKSKAASKRRVEAEAWMRHILIDRNPKIDRRE